MNELHDKLIEACQNGDFLDTAIQFTRCDKDNREQVTQACIELHNKGEINLIDQFMKLQNNQNSGPDFFLTRHLVEKSLPQLNAPIQKVMECVAHLVKEAGQDMAANWTLNSFIEFCSVDIARPDQALKLIKENPDQWGDFICPIVVSGSRGDLIHYFDETINFTAHNKIDIRRRANFALGRINYQNNSELILNAMDRLEMVITQESDDLLLGNAIKSLCSIYKLDHCFSDRAVKILDVALEKAGECALHAASEEFGFNTKEHSEQMLSVMMKHLIRINPNNQNTVNNIDYGIHNLLQKSDPENAIRFLENFLMTHAVFMSLKSFKSVVHGILEIGPRLINRLLTRWFLKGERVLCEGIREIVHSVHGEELVLGVDSDELSKIEPMPYMFLARKSIGYLFFKPITCASVIISLMRQAQDPELINELGFLLFDPLLLNYTGSLYEYLEKHAENESGNIKAVIQSSLRELDSYLDELKSVGRIPEMFPPQEHRDAHTRHLQQLFSDSYKEAMKGSIVNLICSKSTILYGGKTVIHFQHPSSGAQRTEMELKKHGTEVEFPRQENLDPYGLDYMLRVFRVERIIVK